MTRLTDSQESPDLFKGSGKKDVATEANWQKKIDRALAARRAGQELRKGKPPALSTTREIKL